MYKNTQKAGIHFKEKYSSWKEALMNSRGYDNKIIFEKCKGAMLKIKSGEAAYERDSVLFDKIHYSFPVLSGLLRAATSNGDNLSVLDFGGSLGSSYHQCRGFLSNLKSLRWCVVEQPRFVTCGRELFETEELKFYYDIDECLNFKKPNIALLSGVLQYIENQWRLLKDIIARNFQYVFWIVPQL